MLYRIIILKKIKDKIVKKNYFNIIHYISYGNMLKWFYSKLNILFWFKKKIKVNRIMI